MAGVLAVDGGRRVALDRVDEGPHLGFVGGEVAGHEEVMGQGIVEPRCVGLRDPMRAVVRVGDHAQGAEDLGPLVVAVGGPPAVVDGSHRAPLEAQGEDRGVHVPRRADGRIDEDRRGDVDLGDFGAHEEACHVEVMDRHVQEHPPGHRDILGGRRRGISTGDPQHLRDADAPRSDDLPQLREVRIEAPIEAHLELHPGAADRAEDLVQATEIQIHGLLAEDVLPSPRRSDHLVRVRVGARADQHRIHVGIPDDRLRVRARIRDAQLPRQGLRGVQLRIRDAQDLRAGDAGRDGPSVHAADPARADESKSHISLLRYSRFRRALSKGVPMPGRTSCSTTAQPE